jgi:hypothetical protein
LRELAADLKPDAAVCAGDEGDQGGPHGAPRQPPIGVVAATPSMAVASAGVAPKQLEAPAMNQT